MPGTGVREQVPPLPSSTPRYEYRRLIGRGGAGAVYEAWDRQLQRPVAIKRLEAGTTANALGEARLAASLHHPAFVAVHEVFEREKQACIVMDFVRGSTFSALVAAGPVPRAAACAWIAEIGDALAQAHARRIVHGDIKPGNLMVDDAGRVRVLDFGVASVLDPMRTATDAGPTSGTLRYMAPEMLLGVAASPRTDVYALGLVLLELLQGEQPFSGHVDLALAHHKLSSSAALVPAERVAKDALWALVDRMTRRASQERPQAAEVRAALLRIGNAPPRAPETPGGRRRRLAWASVLASVAAGLAVIAWQTWPQFTGMSPNMARTEVAAAQRLLRDFDADGALDRAVTLLREVLAQRPYDASAAASIAIAYCLLDGSDASDTSWLARADASSQLAVQSDDQLALSHSARGCYLKAAGKATEALPEFERALQLSPHEFHALLGEAELFTQQRDAARARQVLDKAVAAYPRDGVLQDALGTLLYQQSDYPGAEQAFRRAVTLRPQSPTGYANLAVVLLHESHADEALDTLQQGLAARPDSRLYDNLGTVLFSRGRYSEAAAAYERAVSQSHGNPNDYLKWANLADALRWLPGREANSRAAYGHALQLLSPRLKGEKVDASLLSRAGLYAAKLGDVERSRVWTRRAVDAAPDAAAVAFHAIVAAELAGDRALALRYAKQALVLGYPRHLIDEEPDLLALRRTHDFHQLLTDKLP